MVLQQNIFIEQVLNRATIRSPTPEEAEHYRRPFLEPGEGRRPTLSFPRNPPLDGEPPDTVTTIAESANWMARSVDLPKLFPPAQPARSCVGACSRRCEHGQTRPRSPSGASSSFRRTARRDRRPRSPTLSGASGELDNSGKWRRFRRRVPEDLRDWFIRRPDARAPHIVTRGPSLRCEH